MPNQVSRSSNKAIIWCAMLALFLSGLAAVCWRGANATAEDAKEVNRYQFVESELVKHPEDSTKFNHLYVGSLNGFDYVFVRGKYYKIPSEQLKLGQSFPLATAKTKWVPLRIHFSHVASADGTIHSLL